MNELFRKIEKKTGVKMEDVFKVASSFRAADLQDEKKVRNLVSQVAGLTRKRVPKQMEDKIVDMVVKNKKEINPSTISKMMDRK